MLSQVGSLDKAPLSSEMLEKICLTELNSVKIIIKKKLYLILSMASCYRGHDWKKKHQQAQPYINKFGSGLEKNARSYEHI